MGKLKIGDAYPLRNIVIVDEDRLCYQIENTSKGSKGIRTISKALLDEFTKYVSQHPDAVAHDVREALVGKSRIDKFEYGYAASLVTMAKMILEDNSSGDINHMQTALRCINTPFQQIFYGAPGTGKSHAVKKETEAWEKRGRVVRTTFHPDSDYSTFVGAYKPTTESVQRYDVYNKPMTRDGVPVMEQIITYEFVEQAFLQAYIDAWKNREEPEFLIIEEINRGNCAQIFGDLFQLLDRGNDGYSEYAIKADKDLQKHLCKAFEDVEIADYPNVKTGKELLLPGNLYIRATMNTSDQSLFPIDSAFKRRWDWKYVPIAKGNDNGTELNWMIEVDGDLYDWWTFVKTINKHVFDTTNSEDKQLGFFFCKAKDDVISAETFVCKVIFYLWNDVFKDFGFDDKIFEDKEDGMNPKLSFDKFYMANGKVHEGKVRMFLDNLGMMPEEDLDNEDDDEDNRNNSKRDTTRYSINGEGKYPKKKVAYELVRLFINNNPSLSATEVVNEWKTLGNLVSHFIETEAEYNLRTDKPRVKELNCHGEKIYVSTNGWGGKEKMQQLKIAVESKD